VNVLSASLQKNIQFIR